MIEQVTEGVVEANFQTCNPTYQNVAEANERFTEKMAAGDLVGTQALLCIVSFPYDCNLRSFALIPPQLYIV
jgi:hypothetical protein